MATIIRQNWSQNYHKSKTGFVMVSRGNDIFDWNLSEGGLPILDDRLHYEPKEGDIILKSSPHFADEENDWLNESLRKFSLEIGKHVAGQAYELALITE